PHVAACKSTNGGLGYNIRSTRSGISPPGSSTPHEGSGYNTCPIKCAVVTHLGPFPTPLRSCPLSRKRRVCPKWNKSDGTRSRPPGLVKILAPLRDFAQTPPRVLPSVT